MSIEEEVYQLRQDVDAMIQERLALTEKVDFLASMIQMDTGAASRLRLLNMRQELEAYRVR